jgi:hypothetical protein
MCGCGIRNDVLLFKKTKQKQGANGLARQGDFPDVGKLRVTLIGSPWRDHVWVRSVRTVFPEQRVLTD